MALTRDFKETIKARAESDPAFREELLTEGIQALLTGDLDTGKAILRDYINATLGFPELAELSKKNAGKSHANARTQRQPESKKPARYYSRSPTARRTSPRSPHNALTGAT